ncbi:SprT family zinc-dependent metalloprotease [Mesorhizobium sp. BAC0120]|uniref:M48 family metallopeptidase n=1 Tax=Mesorhizobium sp. BAC0120 TaxID=3090670 RepID=UPI00298CBAF6|nr:SprT family zinc-dependent metalloprotease [Mesorhizobium sp. BAC0120]MDW6024536.1 SprT family zinc-dependent metalloprotease [Mesorhizobium sp. BAC0120]
MPFVLHSPRLKKRPPVEERLHEVAGRSLPLKIVENQRARRLTLRIDSGGRGLRITIPPGLARREVERFLSNHQGWLEQRLAKVPLRPHVRPGIKLPVRGVPHLIVHHAGTRGTVEVSRDNSGPILIVHGDRQHLPRRLADFLKREAKREINRLVEKHTATVRRRAKSVRFKDTSSRWGSCTADGGLSFSWRIMMAPPEIINYLVAHEVAHLKEMNHGPKFWKLCTQLCPDTERCRDWLKRNGGALQAIVFEMSE